ncbi:MAG: pyruvate dehydrogenase complex dihydrolipoamide acetyltransferase [Opitutaceae bacterium]
MANITLMPKLSDTMTVGTLVKWLKKEGDLIKTGDMLAEVETDKATMELESYFDGTLLKIFSPAGSQLPIGAPLCAIGKPGETVEAPAPKAAPTVAVAAPATPVVAAPTPSPVVVAAPAPTKPVAPAAPSAPAGRVKISPLARKLAEEKRIDFTRVKGTGPGGRIVRTDILAAEKNPPPAATKPGRAEAAPAWGYRSVLDKSPVQAESFAPASNMRATIARRLLEAKSTIPHFYLDIEVDAAPLLALREQLNAGLAKDGVKLSVNDFVLKAAAASLRAIPGVNTSWTGTGIQSHGAIHVSFAVAIEDGLITPVIRDTDGKTLFQISAEAKSLGGRAKDKKLQPAEFTGGTFCVSNLGMAGVDRFCAIINPPNAAILAVGATVKKPVVKDDEIVIGQRMTLTLSCDHRVVDGLLGAKFLNAVKAHLESPSLLLL